MGDQTATVPLRITAEVVRAIRHLVHETQRAHRYTETCEHDGPYEWVGYGRSGSYRWVATCGCGKTFIGGPNPYGLAPRWQEHVDEALAGALSALLADVGVLAS